MDQKYYNTLTNGEYAMFNRVTLRKDDIPVCLEEPGYGKDSDSFKKYTFYRSPLLLFKATISLPNHKRCHYEIIKGDKFQKPYYDIDISLKDDPIDELYSHTREEKLAISNRIVKLCKDALMKIRPQIKTTDILVESAHGDTKRSFHIKVDRWCVQSASLNRELFFEMLENIPLDIRKYFDDKMYKCIQQFRLFLSTKCGKNRQLIVDAENSTWAPTDEITDTYTLIKEIFLASLISVTDGCQLLPMEIKERTNNVVSKELDSSEYKLVMQAFDKFPDRGAFDVLSSNGTFISLKRKRPTFCNVCNRQHENENPFLFVGPTSGHIYFNCRRGEGTTVIGNLNDTFHASPPPVDSEPPRIEDIKPSISIGVPVSINSFIDSGVMALDVNTESRSSPYIFPVPINKDNITRTPSHLLIPTLDNKIIEGVIQDDKTKEISEFRKRIEEKKAKWTAKLATKRPDVALLRIPIY